MTASRPARRILVTRPIDQARDWVHRLRERGLDAHALPLIAIAPPTDPQPVAQVWAGLAELGCLMFVSPSAVAQFFAARPARADWPVGLRAAAPGPGTRAALVAAGVPRSAITEPDAASAQFDSESLWHAMVSQGPWAGASVLILRGGVDEEAQGQGREWLSARLREAGAKVASVAVYRRGPPVFTPDETVIWRAALNAPADPLWLVSSSEALDHGETLAREQGHATAWHAGAVLATHPRIAMHARELGFGRVSEAKAGFESVAAALLSPPSGTGAHDARP